MNDYTPTKEVLDMAAKALGLESISIDRDTGMDLTFQDIAECWESGERLMRKWDKEIFGPGFAEFAAERIGSMGVMYWPGDTIPWSAIRHNTQAYGPHIDAAVLELCAAIGRAIP